MECSTGCASVLRSGCYGCSTVECEMTTAYVVASRYGTLHVSSSLAAFGISYMAHLGDRGVGGAGDRLWVVVCDVGLVCVGAGGVM